MTDFKAKQATVRELLDRVEDWKGHEVDKFGDLKLDDYFTVTKADQPRDYHVFLFEKMMLCCKEVMPERKDKKSGKNASMLRKDKTASKSLIPEKRKLALKGRIFVSNVNRATLIPANSSGKSQEYNFAEASRTLCRTSLSYCLDGSPPPAQWVARRFRGFLCRDRQDRRSDAEVGGKGDGAGQCRA